MIKSIDFGDKNINDKGYLLGSISPNEDKAVFFTIKFTLLYQFVRKRFPNERS